MSFPAGGDLGPYRVAIHTLFEALAYLAGFRIYLSRRGRFGDILPPADRLWIVVAAIAGAAVGSRILYWFEDPGRTLVRFTDPSYLLGGKTIVGGLLGGWIAVEWIKKRLGTRIRTGDLFAVPLAIGIAVGRMGCLFAGTGDGTYGLETTLPWGLDLGDGIPRHPVAIYEILWMIALALLLDRRSLRSHRDGDLFLLFMAGYFSFRLLVDFLKPGVPLAGLTALQWACAIALLHCGIRSLGALRGRAVVVR